MKGDLRFICSLYLSPLVGALYLFAWCAFLGNGAAKTALTTDDYISGLPTLAWLFGGAAVWCVVYATAMEMVYDLGLRPGSLQAIFASQLLGLVAGAFFHLVVFRSNHALTQNLALEAVGMATGVTLGLVIKLFFSRPGKMKLPREI